MPNGNPVGWKKPIKKGMALGGAIGTIDFENSTFHTGPFNPSKYVEYARLWIKNTGDIGGRIYWELYQYPGEANEAVISTGYATVSAGGNWGPDICKYVSPDTPPWPLGVKVWESGSPEPLWGIADKTHQWTAGINRPPPCDNYGDVNDDGYVTMDDIEEAGTVWGPVTTEKGRRADVNGDGTVNILDTILIRDYVQGAIDSFPVCEAPTTICSWIDSIDVTNLTVTHALYVYALSVGAISSANRKYNELDPKPEELPIGIASWGNALGIYAYSQGAYETGNRKAGCSYAL